MAEAKVAPSRARELKPNGNRHPRHQVRVAPSRARELKLMGIAITILLAVVAPSRARELKQTSSTDTTSPQGRALTGA